MKSFNGMINHSSRSLKYETPNKRIEINEEKTSYSNNNNNGNVPSCNNGDNNKKLKNNLKKNLLDLLFKILFKIFSGLKF